MEKIDWEKRLDKLCQENVVGYQSEDLSILS